MIAMPDAGHYSCRHIICKERIFPRKKRGSCISDDRKCISDIHESHSLRFARLKIGSVDKSRIHANYSLTRKYLIYIQFKLHINICQLVFILQHTNHNTPKNIEIKCNISAI